MPELSTDPQVDWAARADGREHSLFQGIHYTRSADKVRRAAGMWAARNGLRAVTRIADDGAEIVVCFVPKTGKV